MILTFLIYIFAFLVGTFLNLMPTSSGLPSDFESALVYIITTAGNLNGIFPVATMTTVLILGLLVEAGILLFHTADWFITKIRGSGR